MEKKPCMMFTLTDTKPTIFESKVGGVGYIPHDGEVPVGEGGTKMTFLAQVNCADLDLEDFSALVGKVPPNRQLTVWSITAALTLQSLRRKCRRNTHRSTTRTTSP